MYALIFLSLIALTGCETLVIAHDDLRCIDRPIKPLSERVETQSLTLFDEDGFDDVKKVGLDSDESIALVESLKYKADNLFNGLEAHIITYQKRIKSQCDLIKKHNENHKKD
ncbi:MAG: hypothetical protein JKY22_12325 [Flavobacteriaceae bacterium]|nr:hypothetical protein [Flavobacteriaceae bacterium]